MNDTIRVRGRRRSAAKAVEPSKNALYFLGAGFSRPSGLPLATELWDEVLQRASRMKGRAEKFQDDLDNFVEFKNRCFGNNFTRENIDFEEFLGFLDLEFVLGLRGSDQWSRDGNEGQVVVKTLIGQILTERTPKVGKIPSLYIEFAKRLRPSDTVITFNYDILLERALDAVGTRYRLFPTRYKSLSVDGDGIVDSEREDKDVLIHKVHGSVDWFDRRAHIEHVNHYHRSGIYDRLPNHAIFNPENDPFQLRSVVEETLQPRTDPLREMWRVVDIERLYGNFPWFQIAPWMVAPSTEKAVYAQRYEQFYRGMREGGIGNFKMVFIGYSLPEHDNYARQVLYHAVDNYQNIPATRVSLTIKDRDPLLMIDFQNNAAGIAALKKRYAFVDWSKAHLHTEGFTEDALMLF